nr:MAG TPA_asm: hypothetical protein [Caudoviricetes sp.]
MCHAAAAPEWHAGKRCGGITDTISGVIRAMCCTS